MDSSQNAIDYAGVAKLYDAQQKIAVLSNKVFKEELLLEKILEYVIRTPSVSNIRSCRLVQLSWLRSTTSCFRKAGKPLFSFHLTHENSVRGTETVKKSGKLLSQFISAATGDSSLDTHVPAFKIVADRDFFRKENYKDFLKCLTQCNEGLLELEFLFSLTGGSMPFILPHLSLPVLQKLTVCFVDIAMKKDPENEADPDSSDYEETEVDGNVKMVYLLQSILSGASGLKEFSLPHTSEYPPEGFDCLILPSSLTKIELSSRVLRRRDLEVLTNSQLPSLKTLVLHLPHGSMDEQLSRILEHVCTSLVELVIKRSVSLDGSRTVFRLPFFPKLEMLTISSKFCELERRNVSSVDQLVPQLQSVVLRCQTEEMLSKWINNSKYESVFDLALSLHNGLKLININLETMERVHTAFPNVTKLELTLRGMEFESLQYVFMKMAKLTRLVIRWETTEEVMSTDLWDSLLLGIPLEWAAALRATPAFWNKLELNEQNSSIKNLKDLTYLKLDAAPLEGKSIKLISDVVFHFGFLKMEKLKTLRFGRGFNASPGMVEKWASRGGILTETK